MGKLYTMTAKDWPRDLGWLVPGENCTALGYRVCQRALRDLGILEVPRASNRGTRIDAMTRRAGLEPPVWWCAVWAGIVFADAGAQVPQGFPLTDEWLPHVTQKPSVGAAILYGLKKAGPVVSWGNAHHIGIVVRLPEPGQPLMLSIEGNRGYAGTTNDGVAVDIGPVLRTDILGYVAPVAGLAP